VVERELLALPQVGPWTASSALLWGVGAPDAWPTGDVALLRAFKHALGDDGLTLKTMDPLAEPWRPHRGIAARLLWTNLFGAG
jgi:DNA-3-methyladenine glycosylase II